LSFLIKMKRFCKIVYKFNLKDELIINYLNKLEELVFNHGYNRASKMLHGLYSYALRRFVGHYSLPVDKFSADKEGIPVFLKQFLRKDDKKGYCIGHIQSMLTLLDIHSLLGPCTTVPNSDGITRPGVISKSRYTESEVFNGRFFMELYDKTKDNKFLYYSQVWSDLLEKEFPIEEQEKKNR